MKIVISPAKKMQTDGGFLPKSQPVFLDQAEELWSYLHSLDQAGLEKSGGPMPKSPKKPGRCWLLT